MPLDQGVPVDAADMFRKLGYRATHLSELGMKSHSDAEIIDVKILEPVLERFDSEILAGALISVRGTRVTCRLLPVTRAIF